MALVFGAWIEMRQKLATYNAVTAAPWTRSLEAVHGRNVRGDRRGTIRFRTGAKLSRNGATISNEELTGTSAPMSFLQRAEGTAAGGTEASQPAG